jgi:glutaminyl-tRNA synthetase
MRKMVEDGVVRGWDDPRFATIAAYRRRGYTPEAFWTLHSDIGVTKFESRIDVGRLEEALRADLNRRAPRRMAVLDPLKVVITNWGDGGDPGRVEAMQAVNNPEDEAAGTRPITFGPEIYIEREDFMEDPPKKFFRLAPGAEVRLRYAYWITCREVIKDGAGKVIELRCTYDPRTRGGDAPPPGPDGVQRKVKGTLHWVNAADCVKAEVRLVDRLFAAEEPGERTGDFLDDLNPDSLRVVRGCKVERALASATPDEPLWADGIRRFQFERLGYFCVDSDSTPTAPVFNRSVGLKDSWTKEASK